MLITIFTGRKEMFSMTNFEFKSKFADQLYAFIKMKEDLGQKSLSYGKLIYMFDRYLVENNPECDLITQEIVEDWIITMVNNKEITIYMKLSALNQFCRYLAHIGIPCYIPRLPKYRKSGSDFAPYVFSHEEMDRIFKVADSLRLKQNNGNSRLFCVPVVIRLFYSTGLRLNEALGLRNRHINIKDRTITLEITKNNQHRIVPINDSLKDVLDQYIKEREKLPIVDVNDDDKYFFVSTLGNHIGANTFHHYFTQILKEAGIKRCKGKIGPRVHDLRHTFAVHSLVEMSKNGVDLYTALPILSVFLGHRDIRITEQYVRFTQELFPDIISQSEKLTSDIFPNYKAE